MLTTLFIAGGDLSH